MDRAGPSDPMFPRRRADEVVATLARLIVASKAAYREPLLDALFQYRRAEGLFVSSPIVPLSRGRLLAVNRSGADPPSGQSERPDRGLPLAENRGPGRLPNRRSGSAPRA